MEYRAGLHAHPPPPILIAL